MSPSRSYIGCRQSKIFPNQLSAATEWAPVNLDRLQHWIDQGRIPASSSPENPITAKELLESRCVHNVHDGVKLLGDVSHPSTSLSRPQSQAVTPPKGAAEITSPIHIVVSRASKSAIAAIEKAGGSVVCQYYNTLALRDLVKGRTDRKSAAPTRKPDICAFASPGFTHQLRTKRIISSVVLRLSPSRLSVPQSERRCGRHEG